MTRSSEIRGLTGLLVAGLCAATMLGAIPVLRFGLIGTNKSGSEAAITFGMLVDNPVIGLPAREARLNAAPVDPKTRVTELENILAERPLSSLHWLELARARYAAGSTPDKIFDALAMSQLTGPNEASTMAGRAVFGLSLWAMAPAIQRRALTRDLVGGWLQISEARRMFLRIMLESALPQTRTDLSNALSAYGTEGAAIGTRLGLEVAK